MIPKKMLNNLNKLTMRKLIGFILPPLKSLSFGIPVYRNEAGFLEFHVLDEKAKIIKGFTGNLGKSEKIIELPELFHRNVEEGSPALFIISSSSFLFFGTAEELKPHLDGIKKLAGKSFIEELNLIIK